MLICGQNRTPCAYTNIYRLQILAIGYNTSEVDVPLPYLLKLSNLRDLTIEDNVRNVISKCPDPPPIV